MSDIHLLKKLPRASNFSAMREQLSLAQRSSRHLLQPKNRWNALTGKLLSIHDLTDISLLQVVVVEVELLSRHMRGSISR
jgi:hypothetical protein